MRQLVRHESIASSPGVASSGRASTQTLALNLIQIGLVPLVIMTNPFMTALAIKEVTYAFLGVLLEL